MAIPNLDVLMLPILRLCAEKTWVMRDLVVRMADDFGLTSAEREQRVPSGGETVLNNRVYWASTNLKMAGLVTRPGRGLLQATSRGRAVLDTEPAKIDNRFLQQIEEFRTFQRKTKTNSDVVSSASGLVAVELAITPDEQIVAASGAITGALRDALLTRVREGSPAFFEKLILDLLLAMGYGGSRTDAGEQLGGTGDGGVDGVIREDRLGLDRVYVQAKRYKAGNTVGPEMVQAFIGALIGKGANKGVLVTASSFTKAALEVANQSGSLRLVLLDGEALTKLMVQFNVGVRVARTVEIKRVDLDYFEDTEAE